MANKRTEIIKALISEIPDLKIMGQGDTFNLWRDKVDAIFRKSWGEDSAKYKEIHQYLYPRFFFMPNPSNERHDYGKEFRARLDGYETKLKALLFEMEIEEENNGKDALSLIIDILNGFPKFALQINKRHKNRHSIDFNDEYDVQDALHAILILHFDNVKREEPIPHSAGASSSIDFLLRREKIGIEVKMPRKGLQDNTLGAQLAEDKERYKKEIDCKTLIFFIYDPHHFINNPSEIIQDISGEVYGMKVMVVYCPSL